MFPGRFGGPMDSSNYRDRMLRKLARELELPKLIFQVIPRTIATLGKTKGHLKDIQAMMKDIQAMMRHSKTSTTTDVYMQILHPEVRSTVDAIHRELSRKTVQRLLGNRRWQLFRVPMAPRWRRRWRRQEHSRSTLRMRLPEALRSRHVEWLWNLRQRCDKVAEGRWH